MADAGGDKALKHIQHSIILFREAETEGRWNRWPRRQERKKEFDIFFAASFLPRQFSVK